MIKIVVYFEDQSPKEKPTELAGLSKRLNIVGLQPVQGDVFDYQDISTEDKDRIAHLNSGPINKLIVKSRKFTFENYYAGLHIFLESKKD